MGANTQNSLKDPICPTYAAGSISIMSGTGTGDVLNDSALAGQPNGYNNTITGFTVGSFNNGWENGCWSQNVVPTYSSSLIRFGLEGRQS
jgi:hypothetical protein